MRLLLLGLLCALGAVGQRQGASCGPSQRLCPSAQCYNIRCGGGSVPVPRGLCICRFGFHFSLTQGRCIPASQCHAPGPQQDGPVLGPSEPPVPLSAPPVAVPLFPTPPPRPFDSNPQPDMGFTRPRANAPAPRNSDAGFTRPVKSNGPRRQFNSFQQGFNTLNNGFNGLGQGFNNAVNPPYGNAVLNAFTRNSQLNNPLYQPIFRDQIVTGGTQGFVGNAVGCTVNPCATGLVNNGLVNNGLVNNGLGTGLGTGTGLGQINGVAPGQVLRDAFGNIIQFDSLRNLKELYQLYSELGANHMYTADEREVTDASTTIYGYDLEKIVGRIAPSPAALLTPCPALRPLRRYYNSLSVDHFLTWDPQQGASAVSRDGYTEEGMVGYCVVGGPSCGATIPLHRFFSQRASDHIYVSNETDFNTLLSGQRLLSQPSISANVQDWRYEGVECYIWPNF